MVRFFWHDYLLVSSERDIWQGEMQLLFVGFYIGSVYQIGLVCFVLNMSATHKNGETLDSQIVKIHFTYLKGDSHCVEPNKVHSGRLCSTFQDSLFQAFS